MHEDRSRQSNAFSGAGTPSLESWSGRGVEANEASLPLLACIASGASVLRLYRVMTEGCSDKAVLVELRS